jgi:putative FmdB family regulatory protein
MLCYEFQCKRCRETFELTMPAMDRELPQTCPYCGARHAARVYAAVKHYWNEDEALGLKGTGMTKADAMSVTERAKKERGVLKP